MHSKLIRLRGAYVLETGEIASRRGKPLGLHVSPGGYMILDEADRVIGTLTLAGRVYDRDGALVTQLERHDLRAQPTERDLAYELGGTLGLY
ncbi:hypothetical protein K2Z83_22090 [Oscillochloris sp. ZM17-4]|uniref:hypothetical protein n=1 Tax=Oscillochloris sp. ZM17-4 TaxID=2866714 RepID=UPI001C729F2C|nr:hypothetical protein [Oscillochloris sp. ZM17-4]MBX0330357.1 hypothetical protein [Oscillochloris sp. ZM17-4]